MSSTNRRDSTQLLTISLRWHWILRHLHRYFNRCYVVPNEMRRWSLLIGRLEFLICYTIFECAILVGCGILPLSSGMCSLTELLQPWKWRRCLSSKRWLCVRLRAVTAQKPISFILLPCHSYGETENSCTLSITEADTSSNIQTAYLYISRLKNWDRVTS